MRKLLLASAATIGATLAMTGGAMAQPVKPVAPGTVVVHLNGYLQFEFAGYGSTFNRVGLYKLNPITTDGDARLYGGFDAQTLTGVSYGAQIELRTTTSNAGTSAGTNSGVINSAANPTGTSSLYVKRAYGYLGSKDGGYLRIGQGDSAFTLMQDGVVEAFGDGAQFNTDGGESSLLPAAATPANFIYADTSRLYATDKIVYLSPAIAGFSVGGGYEPNSNGLKEGYSNNSFPSSQSAALYSSPAAGDIGSRRKNTVDAVVQYSMKSDAMVFKASGGILYGAPISYDGIAAPPSPLVHGYDALEVYQAGAQVTFAGLTLGANVKGGQVNDSYTFKPKGARDGFTYIIGASYVMGPIVLGGSFYDAQVAGANYPGAFTNVSGSGLVKAPVARTLSEYGAAAGANYVISPNLSLFTQYEYGHRHQPGSSAFLSGTDYANVKKGDGQVQAIAAGATFKW